MKNLRTYIFCVICLLCNNVFGQGYNVSGSIHADGAMPGEEVLKANNETLVLKDGRYVFVSDEKLDMTKRSSYYGPAIRVQGGCTAVLRIPKGVKVSLRGTDATTSNVRAYPAIELPSNSTLVITGEGELLAEGGKGDQAGDGEAGKKGDYNDNDYPYYMTPGEGGTGGTGGTGSAPGIGTRSGLGGRGGTTVQCPKVTDATNFRKPEYNAHPGSNGESSSDMGKLVVLGSVKVTSNKGGIKESFSVHHARYGECIDHRPGVGFCRSVGGGGGGGQGGEALTANYGIGAGAPGSGGGGGGGCGATDKAYWHDNLKFDFGFGGKGGHGRTTGGDGQQGSHDNGGANKDGAAGGEGGDVGTRGANGYVYFSALTQIGSNGGTAYEAARANNLSELNNKSALDHIPHGVINRMTGARWNDGSQVVEFYSGMPFKDGAEKVEIPQSPKSTSHFKGYYDQYGNQVYNAEGNLDIRKATDATFCYTKDKYDKWYIQSYTDIELKPQWSDSVYVAVVHSVESANIQQGEEGSKYTDHIPEYVEVKGYELPHGASTMQLTLRKFYDLNGSAISQLLTEEEKGMSSTNRRYRIADGEEESTTVTLGDEEWKVIVQKYDRNSFPLHWDYSSALTKEQFDSLIINKVAYTVDGNYKYGKRITRPLMESYQGRVIRDWTPTEVYAMPAHECAMTPVVADTTYFVKLNVDKADTDCDLTLSKLSDVRYGEEVTLKANLVGDTRLSLLNIYSPKDSTEIAYTQKDATTYSFLMPDGGAVVDAAFAFAHYGVKTIVADRKKVKMAMQGLNGLLYTDDNDYFQFPDSICGGALSAFEVYRNQRVNVYAEVVEDSTAEEHEGVLRPNVTMHIGTKEYDEKAHVYDAFIDGRVRRYFSFTIDDARDVTLKVFLTSHLKKKINFIGTFSANVSSAFSDMEQNIMEQTNSASACMDDIVYFTVKTEEKDFNHDNVVVSYIDAYNIQRFVPLRDYSRGDSTLFYFLMPNRNVDVTLNSGKKVALKDNFDTPYNNIEANTSSLPDRDPDYIIIMPDSAVAGSVVPFFIFEEMNPGYNRDIHPIVTYANGTKAAEVSDFGYYGYHTAVASYEAGTGWFVMPEDAEVVSMNNGFMYPVISQWFTNVEEQTLTLPAFMEAYTVKLQDDRTYALHKVEDENVAPFTPLLCHMDLQKILDVVGEECDSILVGSNPFTTTEAILVNDLLYVENDITCGELRTKLLAETGRDYLIYTLNVSNRAVEASPSPLYLTGGEEGYGTFYALADEALLRKDDVYLPVVNTGSADPIHVTGIEDIVTDRAEAYNYSLTGVRVGQGYKGIVIRNGKKHLK